MQSKRKIALAILAGKLGLTILIILAVSRAGGSPSRKQKDANSALAPNTVTATALTTTPLRVQSKKNVDLSLIIPTTYIDFQCYKHRFFNHLYSNVIDPPEEIIFIISSVPANISKTDFPNPPPSKQIYVFEVDIQTVILHSAHNAAQNRNFGALLATGEFLTFFDMDHILHPQRFQVIRHLLLKEHPGAVDAALFGYVEGSHKQSEEYQFEEIELEYLAPPFRPEYLHSIYRQIVLDTPQLPLFKHWCCQAAGITTVANRWGTYRRELFLEYQYNEDLNKGEDSDLNVRLMLGEEKFTFWEVVLGFYEPSKGRGQLCEPAIGALH